MATTQKAYDIHLFIHSFILSSINSFIKESLICLFINAFNIICRRPFFERIILLTEISWTWSCSCPKDVPKIWKEIIHIKL